MKKITDYIIALLGRIPEDKCRHAVVMVWVAALVLLAARAVGLTGPWPLVVSWGEVSAIGLWKELHKDAWGDVWDLVANYVGATAVWLAYMVG